MHRVPERVGAYRSVGAGTAKDYKSPTEAAFPHTSVKNWTLYAPPYCTATQRILQADV